MKKGTNDVINVIESSIIFWIHEFRINIDKENR